MKIFYILPALLVVTFAQDALKELVVGNLKFAAKTYTELVGANAGKNFLVCPLSVEVVLALAEAGAGGDTAQQLITGLNLPPTEERIHEAFRSLAPTLNVNKEYTLASANKVYVKKGSKLKSSFKLVATDVFKAEVSEIDFVKNDVAAEEINKWVSEKTHDKIKNLLQKDDLGADTRAVLVNALYFHGLWTEPFYVEGTTEKSFTVSSTKTANVQMMEQTKRFNYYEDTHLKAKFLEMHYSHSPLSMVFVLPDAVDGLSALEANIDKVLEVPQFEKAKVHVQIPRIKMEAKIDFIPILQKFGITDAFGGAANFSRLIEDEEKLVISKIIQKTFIDVEEKGTTAAAATAVLINRQSAPYPEPITKEFNANHQFIFYIKATNGILFIGRYIDPPH